MPCPKGGDCWNKWGLCGQPMYHLCQLPQFCPITAQGHVPFFDVFIPDLVQGCGVEWAGGRVTAAAWIKGAVLQPGTWVVPVGGLSQVLFTTFQLQAVVWGGWSVPAGKCTTVSSPPGVSTQHVRHPGAIDLHTDKVHRGPTHPCWAHADSELWVVVRTTPQAFRAVSAQLDQVPSQGSSSEI